MTNDEIIEIAKEAGWPDSLIAPIIMAKLADVVRLVADKERKSNFHSLRLGEMELRLIRDHNGELIQHRYKFSADQVMQSLHLPSMVARTVNNRIKQLAVEAGAIEAKDITNIPRALSLNGEEIGKFAELIINDCLAQVDKVDEMLDDPAEKVGAAWVGLAIARHFGVEE